MPERDYSLEDYLNDMETFDGDGEPWERCGCAACQATMNVLYGSDPSREQGDTNG